MTTIELKSGYFIEIDPLNYTLKQKFTGKSKSGKEKESVRTFGYYGNLSKAIERYIQLICMDITDGETMRLKEYADTADKAARIALHGIEEELRRLPVK